MAFLIIICDFSITASRKIAEVIREVKRTLSGLIFTSERRGFYMTQEYCPPHEKGAMDISKVTEYLRTGDFDLMKTIEN